MNEIIPAIIPENLNVVREKFGKIIGAVKKVQMDIVDGMYAPVKTWPFVEKNNDDLMKFARGEEKFPYIDDFILEIDMLILHPIEYINELIEMGAKSFVIHIDSTDHVKECLETIRSCGCEAGLGIKPSVETSLLETYLPQIDFIQFMGNDRVGYNGVPLDEKVLKKIKSFHEQHRSIPIQIDIGVNRKSVPLLKEVGVSRFISSSTIFNSPNPKQAIMALQSL